MIFILFSWFYIFITSFVIGILLEKKLHLSNKSIVETICIGLFGTCIFSFFWAFFDGINLTFFSVYSFLVLLFGLFYRKYLYKIILEKILNLKKWNKKLIYFSILFFLIIAFQAATSPSLPDNESYYIQTIKWINAYGFVPGLGNLHLFFAQTSGWHVLQSVYNFEFLSINIQSLSSFITVLFVFFSFKNLNLFFTKKSKINLVFGLLPVFYFLFFPLINVPSPDVATYLVSILLFYLFLDSNENPSDNFKKLLLLSSFLVLIKITNLPFLLFPIFYFWKHKAVQIKNNVKVIFIAIFSFGILVAKNAIITGYLFYPLHNFGIWNTAYKIPTSILDYFFGKTLRYSFFIDAESLKNASVFFLCKQWLLHSFSDLFFNASILLSFLIFPLIMYHKKVNSKIWILYFILLFQFILLIFSSPQYRFFLGTILLFFCFAGSYLLITQKLIYLSLLVSVFILSCYTFTPQIFSLLSTNKIITKKKHFTVQNIFLPPNISSLDVGYIKTNKQNLPFYYPNDSELFWQTGNGKLPCVSKKQIDYFEKYFGVIPQKRTNDLKDGFYAKKINTP